MLGDKAYDSAELREELDERGTRPVIPNRSNTATGSNRSALASASTSFAGASKLHSTG
jgi:IS5 family transposase